MDITINGKEYELVFGLKFIRELDKTYTQKIDGMEFGVGIETAIPYLKMKNPVVLYEIIKAATSHLKSKPSNADIEKELEELAEEDKLEQLFEDIETAMGESAFLKPKMKIFSQAAESTQTD